ncbi:MAG: ATP-binding cassette domain-containing protein [Prevotellaceae bacterium]|jgi:D-methionine transport system ATP-binding protein|nr:ATP-binding cassette domain-containing protein [Prevotellaceae bacterium]
MSIQQENIISFKNVSVTFSLKKKEITAVKDVSFDVHQGEIFGIIGTSGAGKSTLLRTVNLLQRPTEGQVLVNNEDITFLKGAALQELRTNIGMIFQQFNLINAKTVYDNIAFVMKVTGKGKDEIRRRTPEVLELVGLSDRAQAYPSKLSGGEKQRVGIARALANNPYILLCDEPTSSLDLENTNVILQLLKDLNRKLNITTVIISHEMHVIKKICNRVAVMNSGEVIELDEAFNIFTNPEQEYTKSLVSHTLDMDLPKPASNENAKTLKLFYSGNKAHDAVISDTIRKFDVNINILLGKIEYITCKPFGVLVIELSGKQENVAHAEHYIRKQTYRVEEVKYVTEPVDKEEKRIYNNNLV